MTNTHLSWRLVGECQVRTCLTASLSTWEVKKAVGRSLCLSPQWIEISQRGCTVEGNCNDGHRRDQGGGDGEQRLHGEDVGSDDVVMVSIVMPRFARFCNEPATPREQKPRVTNQKAVRELAWQPGLLSHEDGRLHPSNRPPSYPIFVTGISNLPGRFLRIDLESNLPTLSCLRQRLTDVTGMLYDIAFGDEELRAESVSGRKYLHMLKMTRGSVVRAIERRRAGVHGEEGPLQTSPTSVLPDKPGTENANINGSDSLSTNLKRNRVISQSLGEKEGEGEEEDDDYTGRLPVSSGQDQAGSAV
ncbi:hypothetical protein GUITHDRAFT_143839 [Guillardia theta CCMP2712]|uniref:Uncharacterized protein n=1 Tax=Guillardia theta (strain CCMP2712) TaxID=905079 RepID=L1IRY7_GUITC|nr:hypothetical protein GUITHDRAFT_143839 [Guillardia theta CCMP2712]EKX39036.1 hypothetical protein GUITHDRAFT_143839 [Guillardia theta CCMP2712]|eukprot:XP_005826016.1 hypothetical protein GUITHDRAFT_143839 [Guillardia theta CCMP2712]